MIYFSFLSSFSIWLIVQAHEYRHPCSFAYFLECYFWMKNVNNFLSKGSASSVAYKKKLVVIPLTESQELSLTESFNCRGCYTSWYLWFFRIQKWLEMTNLRVSWIYAKWLIYQKKFRDHLFNTVNLNFDIISLI